MLTDRRRLKNAAANSIKNAVYSPRKLVAIYTAVMLAVSLAVLAIDFVLEQQIGNTGGLSGMGTRSILKTAQLFLQQAQLIALPFWLIGWMYATVKVARGQQNGPADLLQGFRQFFPFLRLTVLKGLIFAVIILAGLYAGCVAVMMSPMADSVMESLMADMTDMTQLQLTAEMEKLMIPMVAYGGVVALVALTPAFYRFRLAEFVMLDSKCNARTALRSSWQLMKGNMWKMMALDLSFWWFWLLGLAASALAYADVFLPLVGITLPWSSDISYFLAFLLAALAQLVINYYYKAKVDVTYAHAYMELLPKEE